MSEQPGQPITPYLLYSDVGAAVSWLTGAFGFKEVLRYTDEDGVTNHAEIQIGDGLVMLGNPGPFYRNPDRLGGVTQFVHVYVDDVDAHFDRAVAHGARIINELEDQPYGDRSYDAADLEGHNWSFAQHLRDVPPEEWGAVTAGEDSVAADAEPSGDDSFA